MNKSPQLHHPIYRKDHEDIAIKLYEKFGKEFDESKIHRLEFTDLINWVPIAKIT